jgi:hypothetical protein
VEGVTRILRDPGPVRRETHTHWETENNFSPDNGVEPLVG